MIKNSLLIITILTSNYNYSETLYIIDKKIYSKGLNIVFDDNNKSFCGNDYLSCDKGNATQTSINGSKLVTWSCNFKDKIENCEKISNQKSESGECYDYSNIELKDEPTNLCKTNYGQSSISISNGKYNWSCYSEEGNEIIEKSSNVSCSADIYGLRKSCLKILENGLSSGSGVYTLNIEGKKIETYCDMQSNGGGWTLVSKFNASNLICNYRDGQNCNVKELNNNLPNVSALMNIEDVKTLNTDSQYREIRAVGGGYDVVIRRSDKVFPLEIGIMAQNMLQCRNLNTNTWFNYTIGNDSFYAGTRGLGTWTSGLNYIGYTTNLNVCGNGIMFSGENETNKYYQAINGGFRTLPTTAGVFYIR